MTQLDRLFQYNGWANMEALRSIQNGASAPRSLRWMAHIVGSEYLWLARLRGEDELLPVWPELDLPSCGAHLEELSRRWRDYLDERRSSLADKIRYTNSKGETWSNTIDDILTHVVIHSAYHRGQIASDLRATGSVPAYTDYIHAARQGYML
jgi:uncharacterized damage-inducible protein DinB